MRSFVKALATAALISGAVLVGAAAQQDAAALYSGVMEREEAVRTELSTHASGTSNPALLRRVRAVVSSYEGIVGRFPRSGYSDNALWQGATLAADAFWHFGEAVDRTNALRLFGLLRREYPTSSLLRQIDEQTARLTATRASGTAPAALKAIRRETLPDALRITLELERETVFHDERIDGPPRVFLDLQNTQAVEALKDATIAFPDDVVRQIRVGRQTDSRTRVVLDLKDAGRYSVYPLYNPYRVVVDIERLAPPVLAARNVPVAPAAAPSAPRSAPVVTASAVPTRPTPAPATALPATPPPPAAPSTNTAGGFSLSRQLGLGASRVVIDAGHGGHDPGAQVRGLNEADLTLDIALRLEKLLQKLPGVEVVLTRRTNVYVALEQRTAIANRENADLFLSIHANASAVESATGIETYFLNFAPNPAAEAIAARENAGSARTMNSLPDIVKTIATNNKIDESRDFAGMVQASLFDRLRRANRNTRNLGVKQAPFMVLIGATMPSVLAEVSFLTNQRDAALLKTASYRQQIAEALLGGITRYQQSLKRPAVASR